VQPFVRGAQQAKRLQVRACCLHLHTRPGRQAQIQISSHDSQESLVIRRNVSLIPWSSEGVPCIVTVLHFRIICRNFVYLYFGHLKTSPHIVKILTPSPYHPPAKFPYPFIALERGVLFALLEGDRFPLIARSGCLFVALRPCVLLRVGLPAVLTQGCVGGAIDATDLRERALLGLGAI
jgi:hypothetical protein